MNTKSIAIAFALAAGFATSAHASNIVTLETVCTNQDGKVLLEGTATVMPPK